MKKERGATTKKGIHDDGEIKYIFRPCITLKDGRKIWASHYGKKAFRIPVA